MILGFTGTRNMPTEAQINWLGAYLTAHMPAELHHGACVGADAEKPVTICLPDGTIV